MRAGTRSFPRPDAHDLPRKLKTLEVKAERSWLHATLTVKSTKLTTDAEGEVVRPGLPASRMFILSPPRQMPSLPRAQGQLTLESHGGMCSVPPAPRFNLRRYTENMDGQTALQLLTAHKPLLVGGFAVA